MFLFVIKRYSYCFSVFIKHERNVLLKETEPDGGKRGGFVSIQNKITLETSRIRNIDHVGTNANVKYKVNTRVTIAVRLCLESNSNIIVSLVVKQIPKTRGVSYIDDGYAIFPPRRNFNSTYIVLSRKDRCEMYGAIGAMRELLRHADIKCVTRDI